MLQVFNNFLAQLNPTTGLLLICAITAVIFLWKSLAAKDAEIERLREERNAAVEKKDVYIEQLHQEQVLMTKNNTEALTKVASSTDDQSKSIERLTASIYQVLSSVRSNS